MKIKKQLTKIINKKKEAEKTAKEKWTRIMEY